MVTFHLLPLQKPLFWFEIVVIFTKTPIINLVKIIKDIDRCLVFHAGMIRKILLF